MSFVIHFLHDEAGATAIEYGLIAALVALTAIIGIQMFGDAMLDMYVGSEDSLSNTIQSTGS